MIVAPRERGQVLILLATWWLVFGGGAASALLVYDRPASEIKKAVKRVITDDDRRNVILADIGNWEYVQEKDDEKVSAGRKELLKTLRRQDAQRSELEPLMAQLDETFIVMDRDFLNLRFRVKKQVTSAEWVKIVARPNR
jgi:hypothetical protein